MDRTFKRGDIYYAKCGGVVGSEQLEMRPVAILQNNVGNLHSPTVIAAPLKNKYKGNFPVHVNVQIQGLQVPSTVSLEQIRVFDNCRLQDNIGKLDDVTMQDINAKLIICLNL